MIFYGHGHRMNSMFRFSQHHLQALGIHVDATCTLITTTIENRESESHVKEKSFSILNGVPHHTIMIKIIILSSFYCTIYILLLFNCVFMSSVLSNVIISFLSKHFPAALFCLQYFFFPSVYPLLFFFSSPMEKNTSAFRQREKEMEEKKVYDVMVFSVPIYGMWLHFALHRSIRSLRAAPSIYGIDWKLFKWTLFGGCFFFLFLLLLCRSVLWNPLPRFIYRCGFSFNVRVFFCPFFRLVCQSWRTFLSHVKCSINKIFFFAVFVLFESHYRNSDQTIV